PDECLDSRSLLLVVILLPPRSPLFPYTTLFRSRGMRGAVRSLSTGDLRQSDELGVSPFDPLLHALEVVLRNRIDYAVSAKYPIDPDLQHSYRDFPSWLDAVDGPLIQPHVSRVEQAKEKVHRDLRRRY